MFIYIYCIYFDTIVDKEKLIIFKKRIVRKWILIELVNVQTYINIYCKYFNFRNKTEHIKIKLDLKVEPLLNQKSELRFVNKESFQWDVCDGFMAGASCLC